MRGMSGPSLGRGIESMSYRANFLHPADLVGVASLTGYVRPLRGQRVAEQRYHEPPPRFLYSMPCAA